VRVLLDEQLPVDLAATLRGHSVDTVVRRGWIGITNGELLRRMGTEYDALVTMDRGIEFQQNLATVSVGILLVRRHPTEWCIFYHSYQRSLRPSQRSSQANSTA
jgi:hypothetical protein